MISKEEILKKYPEKQKRSAILPLLDLAQRQNNNWLSITVMEYIANYISQPYMRVYEVATFYTMFNTKPVGKYHVQVCGTTPCWLSGATDILKSCEKHAKAKLGNTSKDGLFTISEVECLGACVNAPMMQINDDFYENLDDKKIKNIIQNFRDKNPSMK